MDEGRLGAVRRSVNYNRKITYVMNDIIRHQHDLLDHCLSREQNESRSKMASDVVSMRRTVVRNHVLVQCLQMRREKAKEKNREPQQLGIYEGRPLNSFSRDIDQRVAWYHPKLRRLRKVAKIKQSCLNHGDILDQAKVKEKISDFFSIPLLAPDLSHRYKKTKQNKATKRSKLGGRYYPDDDFDIHDFPDPFGAAKIELKLDPSGRLLGYRPKYAIDDINDQANTGAVSLKDSDSTTETRPKPENDKEDSQSLAKVAAANIPNSLANPLQPLPPIPFQTKEPSPVNIQSSGSDVNETVSDCNTGAETSKDHKVTEQKDSDDGIQSKPTVDSSATFIAGDKMKDEQVNLDQPTTKDAYEMERPKLTRVKTLILPPIKTTKEMVRQFQE